MEQVLFFVHYGLLLIFGIALSAAFSGIAVSKTNLIRLAATAFLSGILQIAIYCAFGENAVWQNYPIVTHLPTILALWVGFGKRFSSAAAATASAYLCCQPAKWLGIAASMLTGSPLIEHTVRIAVLLITALIILPSFSIKIASIYSQKHKSSWVFGIIPVVYYLFDYAVGIYSSLWTSHNRLTVEFLPLFLCIGHLIFCAVYYREYELKNEAERKEQLLRITVEQQAKEVETIRRSEAEIRILRHDMRLFLNSLSSCIEHSDKATAQKMISGFVERAEASSVKRYCANDTLNYLLSDYAAQCREKAVLFHPDIKLTETIPDEILFSSIVANALDNALNAQEGLVQEKRIIRLMLKNHNGKTLFSVKNAYCTRPVFQDGIPVSFQKDHGYGVRSIQYAAEKMGGNYQFILEDEWFILRVVI